MFLDITRPLIAGTAENNGQVLGGGSIDKGMARPRSGIIGFLLLYPLLAALSFAEFEMTSPPLLANLPGPVSLHRLTLGSKVLSATLFTQILDCNRIGYLYCLLRYFEQFKSNAIILKITRLIK